VPFDPTVHLALDAQGSLGTSASGVSFATSTGDVLEVSAYGPGVFRLRAGPNNRPDYGLVQSHAQACTVANPQPGTWQLASGDARLEIAEAPLRLALRHEDATVLASATDLRSDGSPRFPAMSRPRRGEEWIAAFALAAGEPVYGLGERFGPLDQRGQLVESWVEDAQGVNTGRAYKCAPFAWSAGPPGSAARRGAWGVFVNTPGRVVHGVGHPQWSHRTYLLTVEDEALDLFLLAGRTPAEILDRYTQLTGRAAAVPPWSLGLWVSQRYRNAPEEAIGLASALRERRIPADAIALDDRSAWNATPRFDLRWDPTQLPDAAAALAALHALDFRVGVTQSSRVATGAPWFGEFSGQEYILGDENGLPYVLARDGGADDDRFFQALGVGQEYGLFDFTNPAAAAWWRDAHDQLFGDGIDAVAIVDGDETPDDAYAFNGDPGERLHNVQALLHARCVHEATIRYRRDADSTPVVLARAGWTGSQRASIAALAEAQRDWDGLAASIRGALSWGMSGVPFHAATVGGHYGPPPSAELWVRWLQAGVFASHLMLAGGDGRLPWELGAEAEAAARKWLAFRYRLLPYLQRAAAAASRTGLPVMRAMPLAFPGNALAAACETQFMCGDALLVAPILAPGGEVEVGLPSGAWYDLNSRHRFQGPRVLRYRAALDQFPVFGREGYALPLGPAVPHTGAVDRLRPLDALWVFGPPAQTLAGFVQVSIGAGAQRAMVVDAATDLALEVFGEIGGTTVIRRDRPSSPGAA